MWSRGYSVDKPWNWFNFTTRWINHRIGFVSPMLWFEAWGRGGRIGFLFKKKVTVRGPVLVTVVEWTGSKLCWLWVNEISIMGRDWYEFRSRGTNMAREWDGSTVEDVGRCWVELCRPWDVKLSTLVTTGFYPLLVPVGRVGVNEKHDHGQIWVEHQSKIPTRARDQCLTRGR